MTHPEKTTAADANPSLTEKLMRGTAWALAMRWGIRGLGLVSTAILARLLTPRDFGLVAMAMALAMLAETLTSFGVETALLRDKSAGRDQFDTAWTIRLFQLIAVGAIVFVLAPYAADFYGDPRVADVTRVMALGIALKGFENIGIIYFRKELRFDRDFQFNVAVKFISVLVTISLAFYFRSYWALIIGMVAKDLVNVALSYFMSRYRPRLSLSAWQEIWGFSQWALLKGIAEFLYRRADILFIGRYATADLVGQYSMTQELAEIPSDEISMPLSRALVPGFAQMADDPPRLKAAFLKGTGALAITVLPLCMGLALLAPEIVPLLLGPQWYDAIPYLQIFALFAVFRAFSSLTGNLIVVLGHIKFESTLSWLRALIVIAGIWPAFSMFGIIGVAVLKGLCTFLTPVLYVYYLTRITDISWFDFLGTFSRPVLSVATMVVALILLEGILTTTVEPGAADLAFVVAAKVFLGGLAYCCPLILAWHWAGKPRGLEYEVMGLLRRKVLSRA